MATRKAIRVKTKVLHPRYVEEIAELDDLEFGPSAWPAEMFGSALGFVAVDERDELLGYLTFVPNQSMVMLTRVCVRYTARRMGIGTELISRLKYKLSTGRRSAIGLYAPEDNLDFHLFLKANGFRATKVVANNWPSGLAAYVFFWGGKRKGEGLVG